jgi:hypothetical protein
MQEKLRIRKEVNMKTSSKIRENKDDMRPEYDFSDSTANKYAVLLKNQDRLVTLEPDVFKVFHTSEQVNTALRAFINAIPKQIERI